MTMTVRCPQCGNHMQYQPSDNSITDKTKTCVYCNKSFKVRDHLAAHAPDAPTAEFKQA